MNITFRLKLTTSVFLVLILSAHIDLKSSFEQNNEQLHQLALDQADEIDLIVELLAEAANKGKFDQKSKKDSLIKFGHMRTLISNVKEVSLNNLPRIIGTNEIMIHSLEFMTNNNFKVIPSINNTRLVRRPEKLLTIKETQEKLKLNEKKLEDIQKTFKNIGLSTINRLVRNSEKIITKFNIYKAAYRLTPYGLILGYIIYISSYKDLKDITSILPKPVSQPILFFKKKLMGTDHTLEKKEVSEDNSTAKNNDNVSKADPLSELQKVVETGNFVKIEMQPLIKWAPATFLVGLIKKDWEDISSFIKKNISYVYSKLKKEIITEDTIFSKPMLSPESLDLFDISEFKNIKNWFKYKNLFDLAEHSVDKAYLFVGHQTTGFYIADILTAQLEKELNKDARILQLNASDFVPPKRIKDEKFDKEDKLPKILADAKKHDICIIMIKDIDWISEQQERTIARLDQFLDDVSKKDNILVIASTQREDKIGGSVKNKLVQLDIDNFSSEQRLKFIKAQLRADHALQDMDLATIVQQTETFTLADLKKIVQDAYTLSYTEHKPFNKRHLAQSAAKMASKHK